MFYYFPPPVRKTVSSVIEQIQSPSTFFFVASHNLLFNEATKEEKLLPAPSKEDLRNTKSSSFTSNNLRKQLGFNSNAVPTSSPLLVSILESASPTSSTDEDKEKPLYAPTLTVSEPLSSPCVKISVPLDVLGFLRPTLPLFEVATVLKEAITAQLNYTADVISWQVRYFKVFSLSARDYFVRSSLICTLIHEINTSVTSTIDYIWGSGI